MKEIGVLSEDVRINSTSFGGTAIFEKISGNIDV